MLNSTEVRNIKNSVLTRVFHGKEWTRAGKGRVKGVEWPTKDKVTHVRFRFTNQYTSSYSFSINRNTLTAQYALWICGSELNYYLIPVDIINLIYKDPDMYKRPASLHYQPHPQTPIMTIALDIGRNAVIYTSDDSIAYDLSKYKRGTM